MNKIYIVNITLRHTPPKNFISYNIKLGFDSYSIPFKKIIVRRKGSQENNFVITFKLLNEQPLKEVEAIIWNNILDYEPIHIHAESY